MLNECFNNQTPSENPGRCIVQAAAPTAIWSSLGDPLGLAGLQLVSVSSSLMMIIHGAYKITTHLSLHMRISSWYSDGNARRVFYGVHKYTGMAGTEEAETAAVQSHTGKRLQGIAIGTTKCRSL